MSEDERIGRRIEALVNEEHELWHREEADPDGLREHDRRRLEEVRVRLDQWWDLLRQRRAHEEFGLNPDEASTRDASTVEGYEQ